jgi:hypothetical protein
MTHIGLQPKPDPNDPEDPLGFRPESETDALPDEEHVDETTGEDDLDQAPEEKRNATDGYAPADDDAETTPVDDLTERGTD